MLLNMFKKRKNKKGFVSLETLITAGMIIIIASLTMGAFSRQATSINQNIHSSIEEAQNQYTPSKP